MTERPVPLDPTWTIIGLPDPETAASVDMWDLLPHRLQELCTGKECLKELDQEVLRKTRKCPLVRQGEYAQLIQKHYDTAIVELVGEEPK